MRCGCRMARIGAYSGSVICVVTLRGKRELSGITQLNTTSMKINHLSPVRMMAMMARGCMKLMFRGQERLRALAQGHDRKHEQLVVEALEQHLGKMRLGARMHDPALDAEALVLDGFEVVDAHVERDHAAQPAGRQAMHGADCDQVDVRRREATEQLAARVLHMRGQVGFDLEAARRLVEHGPFVRYEKV